ncbi:hypothetical protein OXT66_03345 [Lentilactobacillus senioris]|uniref:hypothetical protein n=1 Tax=Lentilactobacillus senioris TaxID=931534 RepID=UPI00227F3B1B|nr:hypothetical protein [Lentilactobacillus senioris]MCY9806585.1 hypothetical protein [Lentilactobacillus senioris]
MEKLLDKYLNNLGLTRAELSRKGGISVTALQRSSDKDAFSLNKNIPSAISMATGKTPGQVLDEITELEMRTDITTEEFKLLINRIFKENKIEADIYNEDLGYPIDAVVVEITLPSSDTVRFGVHFIDKDDYDEDSILSPVYPDDSFVLTKDDILQELADSMRGYDNFNEDDGFYYPAEFESTVGTNHTYKTDYEIIGICKKDSDFLANLGKKLLSYRG